MRTIQSSAYHRRMPEYSKRFLEADYYEHVIVADRDGEKVGTIRVKPVSILWKPKGAQKYFSASIEAFEAWITANGRRVGK